MGLCHFYGVLSSDEDALSIFMLRGGFFLTDGVVLMFLRVRYDKIVKARLSLFSSCAP